MHAPPYVLLYYKEVVPTAKKKTLEKLALQSKNSRTPHIYSENNIGSGLSLNVTARL